MTSVSGRLNILFIMFKIIVLSIIDKIDTHITQINDRSLYCLGTDTSIKKAGKGGGVKHLNYYEIILFFSFKNCIQHV
jgi:hypothetical protein